MNLDLTVTDAGSQWYAAENATRLRLRFDLLYVISVPILAAVTNVRGVNIAGFNFTGFLWLAMLLLGGMLLVAHVVRPSAPSYFPAAPWLAWTVLVLGSLAWVDSLGGLYVKDALQLCMPVLIGIIAGVVVRSRAQLEQLIRAFYYAVPPLVILSGLWVFGLVEHLPDDPNTLHVTIRSLSTTAVICGAVFLASSKMNFTVAWLGWAVCMAITVATGSRIASVAMLLLPIFNPITRNPLKKTAAIVTIVCIGGAAYLTPMIQQRFFQGGSGGVNQIAEGNFDDAGRFDVWPLVLEAAWERPWLGHGIGSSQFLIPEIWRDQSHPHNDYLRIGYELGSVGLALFMLVVIWQLWSLGRQVRRTEGAVQQAFASAWLGWIAFLVIAFTDNPIVYHLWYMNPLFALMGAAYTVAREEKLGSLDFSSQGVARSDSASHSSQGTPAVPRGLPT